MRSVAGIFIVVVFPAPFGPRRPKISPRSTRRSMPSTAWKRSRVSGLPRTRCQIVRRPRSKTLTRARASTAGPRSFTRPARLFDEDLDPVLVVGDVDDLPGEIDAPEELVQVHAELAEVSSDEPARSELHLPQTRDRERDGDVHLLLAALSDLDAQDTAAPARRGRRLGQQRWPRPARPLVDVPQGPQEPVRLVDADLALREEGEDLPAFFARHRATADARRRAPPRRPPRSAC